MKNVSLILFSFGDLDREMIWMGEYISAAVLFQINFMLFMP